MRITHGLIASDFSFARGAYRRHCLARKVLRTRQRQAVREELTMEIRSTRRIVTGHDAEGKAIALFDSQVKAIQRSTGGNGMTMIWTTTEFPVDASATNDRAQGHAGVPPAANGTVFRIVDFAPVAAHAAPVDHHQILVSMGIDPATQGYARHANTHRTRTIDYAIVLDGEIDMLLDDSEVHVTAGDVLVQQGTNHAWVNNSGKPCRIAFILIDGKTPPAWKQGWSK
jgi:mannose-6-phosphate isomerase-like protein (cupin superfamily)